MGAFARAIGLTVMSLVLFGIVSSGYQIGVAMLTDGFKQERIITALRDALFVTIIVFGPWMYFIFQTIVLAVGRFERVLLFILPLLILVGANAFFLYRSSVVMEGQRLFEDVIRNSSYTVPALLFILFNNALIIRSRSGASGS